MSGHPAHRDGARDDGQEDESIEHRHQEHLEYLDDATWADIDWCECDCNTASEDEYDDEGDRGGNHELQP